MHSSPSPVLFSASLGASVSVAIATVFGTAIFNVTTWLASGAGKTFDQAYLAASQNPLFFLLGFANAIIGGMLGGFVAAKLGGSSPYLCAFLAALLAMAGYLVMFITPGGVSFEATAVLTQFVFPVPCALLGAHLFLRTQNNG